MNRLLWLWWILSTAATAELTGAGSTLVCDAIHQLKGSIGSSYTCSGSGDGKAKLFSRQVSYAISDYPLAEEESTFGVTSLPLVAVEVALIYNTAHKGRLLLADEAIRKIFTGEIRYWDEPNIALLNNDFNFTHNEIKVAVRSRLSGTSFILTEALHKFGHAGQPSPSFCDFVNGTCENDNFYPARGTQDVIDFVLRTPHSMGYVGVKAAIINNLPFIGVQLGNTMLLPTIASGQAALEGLVPEYKIPYEITARGYPMEGLAYVLYYEDDLTDTSDCEKSMSLINLLEELYSAQSSEIFTSHWMVSMTSSAQNLIASKLQAAKQVLQQSCENVTPKKEISVTGALVTSSYYQRYILSYGRSGTQYQVKVAENSDDSPIRVQLRVVPLFRILEEGVIDSEDWSDHVFGLRELSFMVRDSLDLNLPARIHWDGMRGIMNGSITEWSHPLIATNKNAFTELPTSGPIRFVLSEEYVHVIPVIAEVFGFDASLVPYEIVSAAYINTEFYKQPILTCVDLDKKTQATAIHTILEGSERSPFQFRNSDFDIDLSGSVSVTHHHPLYPFTYALVHRIPRKIIMTGAAYDGPSTDPCTEHVLNGVVSYLRFSASFGGISGASALTESKLQSVTCNSIPVVHTDTESSSSIILYIVLPVSGFVLLVLVVVGYFKKMLGASQGEIKHLIDNNKLAVECAAAIAEMRLEDMMWITELENPDKLQVCFGKIITNLREYRRYLPDTILFQADSNDEAGRFQGAPESDADVTIVFTDVQSSTALWDAVPDAMATALRVHHKVMRELIKENEGYEVKTIGDAFMVAFRSTKQAVQFGLGIQERLLHAEYPALLQSVEICESVCDKGVKIWGGLRVRVGIHCGEVTSEEDPLTGRKDYFGPTVNKAARVEAKSIGGLLALSEEAYHEVSDCIDSLSASSSMLGKFELPGIKGMHQLYCLAPKALSSRLSLIHADIHNEKKLKTRHTAVTQQQHQNSKLSAFFKSVVGCVIFAELRHNCVSMTTSQLNYVCTSFVDLLDISSDRYNGSIHTHLGNGILMGWNTGGKVCNDYIQSASRCSAHLVEKGTPLGTVRIGMSAGTFATGNAGVRKRTAALSSFNVNVAQLLSSAASDIGVSVLCADLPRCPCVSSTSGVKEVIRPLMKWTIDNTKLAIIYELNCSLVDDWSFNPDIKWGPSSKISTVFNNCWESRDLSGLVSYVCDHPDDEVIEHLSRIPPEDYFNMARIVQAATPDDS